MLASLKSWIRDRRRRREYVEKAAEALVARHGLKRAAAVAKAEAASGDATAGMIARRVRWIVHRLETAKGADRWPGP